MIGPGTGVAPFRAFLEEREAVGATGRNWVFFGNPNQRTTSCSADELAAYRSRMACSAGLDTAFSRDQAHKIYVQHRMLENAARAVGLARRRGASLYVCGDAERMAKDVQDTLTRIIADQSGRSEEEAVTYLRGLVKAGRYLKDVY